MSHWQTPTVIGLCEAMRQTDDYSALPILADALADADYPDEQVLAQMRAKHDDTHTTLRLLMLVYSDETAVAVQKIEELAVEMGPRALREESDGYNDRVPTTYERLMRVGDRWTASGSEIESRDPTREHGSDDLQSWDDSQFDSFWEAYRVITGRSGEGNPFGCSC